MKKYDIFISYRREGGLEMAYSIYQSLLNSGYSVFIDLEQLNSGQFNKKLLNVIENCKDFIMVLPPKALERCTDEEDWVRKELEHALLHQKNIIPIMLRGFDWPEKESLPESIRELPNYNGISATDHNVFIENIERLKRTFLCSKAGVTWHRYKKQIIVVSIVLLLLLVGLFAWNQYGQNQYEKISGECSVKIMNEFARSHHNVSIAESVYEAWKDYEQSYVKYGQEYAREELVRAIEHYRKDLQSPMKLDLSAEFEDVLRKNDVPMEEIGAVDAVYQMAYDEVCTYMDNIIKYSEVTMSNLISESVKLEYDYLYYSMKMNYYGTLDLFTYMPSSIYETLYQLTPTLTYMSDVPLTLTHEEYEAMQKLMVNKLEDIVHKMGGNLKDTEQDVEILERKNKLMEEELKKQYVDQRFQNIEQKKASIEKTKADLAKADKMLADMYRESMTEYELKSTDDQGLMWGKILRMANLAQISAETERIEAKEYNELVEIAKQQGIDPSTLSKPYHSITARDKYNNVDKWLIKYEQLNPNNEKHISKYVAAARAYYKEVAVGKRDPEIGIILVATKDDLEHPQYNIGDIVIERKGKVIRSVSQYFALKDDPAKNVVKVLRLQNGALKQMTLELDDSPVLVGLSPLNENVE